MLTQKSDYIYTGDCRHCGTKVVVERIRNQFGQVIDMKDRASIVRFSPSDYRRICHDCLPKISRKGNTNDS